MYHYIRELFNYYILNPFNGGVIFLPIVLLEFCLDLMVSIRASI